MYSGDTCAWALPGHNIPSPKGGKAIAFLSGLLTSILELDYNSNSVRTNISLHLIILV